MTATSMGPRTKQAPKRGLFAAIAGGLSLLITAAMWVALAPPAAGGHTTLLVIRGNSMEPGMHNGDIAFVSNAQPARVGEVVAYRSPELGIVIHRVTTDGGEHLTLQGDNRTTADPYQPRYDEVVGTLAWRIPGGTRYLQALDTPQVAFALAALTLLGGAGSSKRARRAVAGLRAAKVPALEALSAWHPVGAQAAGMAVVVAFAAGGLLFMVDRTGAFAPTTTTVAFAEHGTLNYSGDVPFGLYEDNRLAAPQPVIRGATRLLNVDYAYQFAAVDQGAAPERVAGAYTLTAVLRHETGWQRELVLRPSTPFAGSEFTAHGTIEMARLDALAAQVEAALGIREGLTTYTLRVVAHVVAAGAVEGQAFKRDTTQTLEFVMDNRVLRLDPTVKKTTLTLDEQGTVAVPGQVARRLGIPLTSISSRTRSSPRWP